MQEIRLSSQGEVESRIPKEPSDRRGASKRVAHDIDIQNPIIPETPRGAFL